jgi:cytosine/adenosine deaminase-related metal-dependent hydrolase
MHLYGDTLESYVARDLPAPTLDVIDAHVSNCLFCAHTLADETAASTEWERRGLLGRLVRTEAPVRLETDAENLQARAA